MTVPAWDSRGVLPPVHPGEQGHSASRSPYRCSLEELISRFGVNTHRLKLLTSFLDYREALHNSGIVNGFQWINGSFVQDVERMESRNPNDIDIVTHFYLPEGQSQDDFSKRNMGIIHPPAVKQKFGMDAYPNVLGGEANASFSRKITYWYSMWSHRRGDNVWKGFMEIDLSPKEDAPGRELIADSLYYLEGENDEK